MKNIEMMSIENLQEDLQVGQFVRFPTGLHEHNSAWYRKDAKKLEGKFFIIVDKNKNYFEIKTNLEQYTTRVWYSWVSEHGSPSIEEWLSCEHGHLYCPTIDWKKKEVI